MTPVGCPPRPMPSATSPGGERPAAPRRRPTAATGHRRRGRRRRRSWPSPSPVPGVASIGLGVVRPGSSVRHRPCNFGPPAPAPTVSASLVTAWVTRMRRRPRPGPFAPDNRTSVPSVSLVSAGPSGAKPPTGLAGLKAQRGARTGPVSAPPGIDVLPGRPATLCGSRTETTRGPVARANRTGRGTCRCGQSGRRGDHGLSENSALLRYQDFNRIQAASRVITAPARLRPSP